MKRVTCQDRKNEWLETTSKHHMSVANSYTEYISRRLLDGSTRRAGGSSRIGLLRATVNREGGLLLRLQLS